MDRVGCFTSENVKNSSRAVQENIFFGFLVLMIWIFLAVKHRHPEFDKKIKLLDIIYV